MSDYAVCNINGKQYKIAPNVPFTVDFLGKEGKVEVEVLMLSQKNEVSLGKPFLKDKITLEVLGEQQSDKVRVSKFHAKANFRRTTGIRPKVSKVVWAVKKAA